MFELFTYFEIAVQLKGLYKNTDEKYKVLPYFKLDFELSAQS